MTDHQFETPEAAEAFTLMVRLFEDQIDEAGTRRLDALICRHPQVRRLYVHVAHQYCAVMPLIAGMQAEMQQLGEPAVIEAEPAPAATEPAPLKPVGVGRAQWIKFGVISAAAMIACTFGLAWLLSRSPSNAVLAGVVNATWDTQLTPGQAVPNQPITLTSGLAKLRMNDGTVLIVQAPATFRISKSDEAELTSGSITATVPMAAHGFAIRTPSARIVDLGTEFGVDVAADHSTVVAVFRGSVEATTVHAANVADSPKSTLLAGQAAQVTSSGNALTSIASPVNSFARADEFDSRVSELKEPAKDRWRTFSYQLRRDPTLVAYYLFDTREDSADVMVNSASTGSALDGTIGSDTGVKPAFSPGRFSGKRALSFHSDALQYMTIPVRKELEFATASPPARAFTVVVWVNAEQNQEGDVSIFTHGKGLVEQYSVGVINSHFRAWVRPRVVTPGPKGNATGPLVTPGWHQLVVTVDPASGQMVFYTDGMASSKCVAPATLLPADASASMLGARVSHQDKIIPSFNGLVDELAVFSRALSESEVQNLYNAEKP